MFLKLLKFLMAYIPTDVPDELLDYPAEYMQTMPILLETNILMDVPTR